MFLTVHASAALLIGQTMHQPVWSFFCALGSHYLLDIIPHGDEGIGWWIHGRPKRIWWIGLVDLSVVFLLVIMFLHFRSTANVWPFVWALIGALLPDFLSETNYQIRQARAPLHRFAHMINKIPFFDRFLYIHNYFHHRLHWLIKRHLPWRPGLFFQFLLAGAFFGLALL